VSKIYDEVGNFLQDVQHYNYDKLSSKVWHKRVSHLLSTHPSTTISIVNQIQVNKISEAIVKLDRYEWNII
jgi:uncharacterized protein YaeQ